MQKRHQISFWYLLFAILAVIMIRDLVLEHRDVRQVDYSEFLTMLADKRVDDLIVGPGRITGTIRGSDKENAGRFATDRVDLGLVDTLRQAGIRFAGEPEPGLLQRVLSWVLPSLIFIVLWMFLLRPITGGAGGLMSIGRSRAKVFVETDVKVTFADVAGVDEAKLELQEIVAFLRNPREYGRLGARMPKGILLVGPPGTGKTLLARAVAGEAGVPFFSISGSEFVEMFVGVGAARVRDLFEQARQHAPAIIFIDELDALGRARGAFPAAGGGHDEKEQTLNQLLSELDGFDTREGVVLLAATNRPEILDPALLRAGRFDRQILVDRPDRAGRVQILAVHLRKVRIGPDVEPDRVAALTPGFSGADLATLVNEAALLATRRGGDTTTMADFTEAVERVVAGLEKKHRLLNPIERRAVACHELGHALVARCLPGSDSVHKISIIPRGIGALGYTIQRPTEDRYLMTRTELENKMAVLLGGRASEAALIGEISTGAADDLVKATDIARSMVMRYGMTGALGQVAYEDETPRFLGAVPEFTQQRHFGAKTAEQIDLAVRALVDAAFGRADVLVRRHRSLIEQAMAVLLEKETLTEDDVARLLPLELLVEPAAA